MKFQLWIMVNDNLDVNTNATYLERLLKSIGTGYKSYSASLIGKRMNESFLELSEMHGLCFRYVENSDVAKTLIRKSSKPYTVFMSITDVARPDLLQVLDNCVTEDADFIFERGGWFGLSSGTIELKPELGQGPHDWINSKGDYPARLVALRRDFLSLDHLSLIFPSFVDLNEDVSCYLRCRQNNACCLGTLRYFAKPLFLKDVDVYVRGPILHQQSYAILKERPEQKRPCLLPDLSEDWCPEVFRMHVYEPWYTLIETKAKSLYSTGSFDEALELFRKLGDTYNMALCMWKENLIDAALSILSSLPEDLRLKCQIHRSFGDEVGEYECLCQLSEVGILVDQETERLDYLEAIVAEREEIVKRVFVGSPDSVKSASTLVLGHDVADEDGIEKMLYKDPIHPIFMIGQPIWDLDATVIDVNQVLWTTELAQMFHIEEHLLLMLKAENSHKYDEHKVKRILAHVRAIQRSNESWVCILDNPCRGIYRFPERIAGLQETVSKLAEIPDVVFLSGKGKAKHDGTRLRYGLEDIGTGDIGSASYLIRKQALLDLLTEKSIWESTFQAFLSKHLKCVRANPPLVWKVNRPERVMKPIVSARPTLLVYGPAYPFVFPVLQSLTPYFHLTLFLGQGGIVVPGLPEIKAMKDFLKPKTIHGLLLIDYLDPIFVFPMMVPTTFWFTGNIAGLQKEPMKLWYGTRNRLPIRTVIINHDKQMRYLCDTYLVEPSLCRNIPLLALKNPGKQWSCEKIIGRILVTYNPDTYALLLALVSQVRKVVPLHLVVTGSSIKHEHLVQSRKHSVQFYGRLGINELSDELLKSEYAWMVEPVLTTVSSLNLSLNRLARTCGCKMLEKNTTSEDIISNSGKIVTQVPVDSCDPRTWIEVLTEP